MDNINKKLFDACSGLNLDMIKEALEQGADINCLNDQGESALFSAIQFWAVDEQTCDYAKTKERRLELENKMIAVVEYLLDNGADINLHGEEANTPLWASVYTRSPRLCRILLDRGANPNEERDKEENPYQRSSALGWLDFLLGEEWEKEEFELERMLREAGARLHVDDYDPILYKRTGKISIIIDPGNDYIFKNDDWKCGLFDNITIPDLEGNMNVHDISQVIGLRDWWSFWDRATIINRTIPFPSDEEWEEWWYTGYRLMKEVKKLLPEYVTLYYIDKKFPIFGTRVDGVRYWANCSNLEIIND